MLHDQAAVRPDHSRHAQVQIPQPTNPYHGNAITKQTQQIKITYIAVHSPGYEYRPMTAQVCLAFARTLGLGEIISTKYEKLN